MTTDDATSYHSADDDTANSTPVAPHANVEEQPNPENEEDININLLKNKMKHMFILSTNGKPVFTR